MPSIALGESGYTRPSSQAVAFCIQAEGLSDFSPGQDRGAVAALGSAQGLRVQEDGRAYRGVFLPDHPDSDSAYLLEVQYYSSDTVYANLLSKIGRFLEHGNPNQNWLAVVIDPNRATEQKNLLPYSRSTSQSPIFRKFAKVRKSGWSI